MPVRKDEAIKLGKKHFGSLAKALRSHSKFLLDLFKEEDWSFVIKSHALIEAVVTQLITEHSGDSRFRTIFERLPISDDEMGKLAVAKHLELLTPPQRRFIRFYSTLRNNLAHKVANVNFKFSEHIAKLDNSQRKAWRESIVWFVDASDESHAYWLSASTESPKLALWMSVFMLSALAEASSTEKKTMKELHELAYKTGEELFSSRKPK